MVQRFEAVTSIQKKYRGLFDAFLQLTEMSTTAELVHHGGKVAADLTGAASASCFVLSNDHFDLCTWATVNVSNNQLLKKKRVPLSGVLHSVIAEAMSNAPKPLNAKGEADEVIPKDFF